MKKTSKIIALLLVFLMVLSISACNSGSTDTPSGSSNQGGTNSSGGDQGNNQGSNQGGNQGGNSGTGGGSGTPVISDRPLNVAVGQDNGSLHPFGVSGTGGFPSVLGTCYEGLYYYDDDGTRIWELATGMDTISDLQVTLHVRQGVKFSNGNPLTADDVVFTIQQNAADPRSYLNVKGVDVDKTKVIDEYTVDLWYKEYNAAQEPGFTQMSIMDKESYDEVALASNPIGTGPYIIKEYIVGSHVTAVARDDYWGETPAIKTIKFSIINEPSQIINALETGAVDTAAIPLKDASYVESLGYVVDTIKANTVSVPYFNMTEGGLLGAKEARWAVCHAIDRQTIVDIVYDGKAKVLDWPLADGLIDFEPRFNNRHETYSIGYNPERAKELAEQTGLIGKTLKMITNGAADSIVMAEIIQGNLHDIGVNAEIVNFDMATYFSVVMDESNYDMALYYVAAPSMMAVDMFAEYLNFVPLGWHGPDRDLWGQLTRAAITNPDPKARGDMMNEYLDLFLDYTPWFALCDGVTMRASAADLAGVKYDLAGGLNYADLYFVG